MAASRQEAAKLADSALVERTRTGDTDAFAELWRRHATAGIAVARSHTSSLEADDLVAESFAKIFQVIQSGGGPTGAFRPYLFTTIRNTAAAWGRARHETAIDDADEIADPDFTDESAIAALDRSLTAHAFRSLPTRWQEALWYSEVEQMTPSEIAPLLGMKPNAVAALTYRAREGLRQAWIQAHLQSVPEDSDCRWTIDRLGAYARSGLGKRDTARIEAHLAGCAKCTIVASEAKDVGSRLALVLLPLVAGAVGATGYTAWLQSGTHATAYALGANGAVMPAAAVAAPGSGGAGSTASAGAGTAGGAAAAGTAGGVAGVSAGFITGLVAASVLVVAGIVAAVTLGPTLFSTAPEGTQTDAGTTQSAPAATPTVGPLPSSTPAVTPAQDATATGTADAPETVRRASETSGARQEPADATPTTAAPPSAPQAPAAPTIGQQQIDPNGVLTASGTGTPGNRVQAVLTPELSSAARGFSRAVIAAPITIPGTIVRSDGSWSITADVADLADGDYRLAVSQTDAHGRSSASVTRTVTLNIVVPAPVITAVGSTTLPVAVSGTAAGADTVDVVLGDLHQTVPVTEGSWVASFHADALPNGHYPLTAIASYRGHASTALEQDVPLAVPPTLDGVNWRIDSDAPSLPLSGTGSPGDELTVTVGSVATATTVGGDRHWSLVVAIPTGPNGDVPVSITQANSDPSLSTAVSPAPTLELRRPIDAPTVTAIDTGDANRYYPVVSGGGALPGATVTVRVGDASRIAVADSSGLWSSGQIDAVGSVTVSQFDGYVHSAERSADGLVDPEPAPTVSVAMLSDTVFHVSAHGSPGATVELIADGTAWTALGYPVLDATGSYTNPTNWYWSDGSTDHTLGARYADGAGRYGPASVTPFLEAAG